MDEREKPQTPVQSDKTDQRQHVSGSEVQVGTSHIPARTSEEFYRRITARDDVREILKRLAR